MCFLNTIVKNPPEVSLLGFFQTKPESKGPYLKDNPNFSKKLGLFFKEGPLSPDFWFGKHPTKKPPWHPPGSPLGGQILTFLP